MKYIDMQRNQLQTKLYEYTDKENFHQCPIIWPVITREVRDLKGRLVEIYREEHEV